MDLSGMGRYGLLLFADDMTQHNWSHGMTDQGPWKEATADANTVRRLGPENFQTFPNHHFFVRLFRHNAVRPFSQKLRRLDAEFSDRPALLFLTVGAHFFRALNGLRRLGNFTRSRHSTSFSTL